MRENRRDFLTSLAAFGVPGAIQVSGAAAAEPDTDVLVCGGGPSGIAAAINAARRGARVTLLERYGRLGGMAVNGLVGPLMGRVESPFVAEVMERTSAPNVDPALLDLEYAELLEEAGVRFLLHTWVSDVLRSGDTVSGVRTISKQGELTFRSQIVIDATGDGDIAARAGVKFEQGRKSDGLCQPMSIMFRVAGLDPKRAIYCGSEEEADQLHVGRSTWFEHSLKANRKGKLPRDVGIVRMYRTDRPGEAIINANQVNGLDGLSVEDLTKAELEGRRQAASVLSFLREHGPGYEGAYISLMPATIGVRETRRIMGETYLTREDLVAGRKWDDAVVWKAFFPVDVHSPDSTGQAYGRYAEQVKPYDIPYGCLVAKGVGNLLTAGRCISGSHEAHASYRVQRIAMAIGAAAGVAAGLSVKRNASLREIDVSEAQRCLSTES